MKNVKEQIDAIINGRRRAGMSSPRYIILDPANRAKLLRISRHSGDSIVHVSQKDQVLKYNGIPIAIVITPDKLVDVV